MDINMFIPNFMMAPSISGCDRMSLISSAQSVIHIKSSAEDK